MAADAAGWSSKISIHALREEGDPAARRAEQPLMNFYPRPPRGGRRHHLEIPLESAIIISIHALREEGDSKNRDKISIFKQIIQHSARI